MEFEDEESASMAEMAALATGNPLMIERVVLDGEVKKLEMAQRSFGHRISAMLRCMRASVCAKWPSQGLNGWWRPRRKSCASRSASGRRSWKRWIDGCGGYFPPQSCSFFGYAATSPV